jgi:hypothetical protein
LFGWWLLNLLLGLIFWFWFQKGVVWAGLFDSGIANNKSVMLSTSKAEDSLWLTVGFTLGDFSLFI